MNPLIQEILKRGIVQDADGNEYPLHSNIDHFEGEFLHNLILSDPTIQRTIEVGCGYGLSSLYICTALGTRDQAKHVIIDPNQSSDWANIGLLNLKKAG